jgi:hypothetical protein
MGTFFLVDLMMSMLAQHIEALFTLRVDGMDWSAREQSQTMERKDVFIVLFVFVHFDLMRDFYA